MGEMELGLNVAGLDFVYKDSVLLQHKPLVDELYMSVYFGWAMSRGMAVGADDPHKIPFEVRNSLINITYTNDAYMAHPIAVVSSDEKDFARRTIPEVHAASWSVLCESSGGSGTKIAQRHFMVWMCRETPSSNVKLYDNFLLTPNTLAHFSHNIYGKVVDVDPKNFDDTSMAVGILSRLVESHQAQKWREKMHENRWGREAMALRQKALLEAQAAIKNRSDKELLLGQVGNTGWSVRQYADVAENKFIYNPSDEAEYNSSRIHTQIIFAGSDLVARSDPAKPSNILVVYYIRVKVRPLLFIQNFEKYHGKFFTAITDWVSGLSVRQ